MYLLISTLHYLFLILVINYNYSFSAEESLMLEMSWRGWEEFNYQSKKNPTDENNEGTLMRMSQ